MATATTYRHDAATVKESARGSWRDILTAVGGIDAALLDGKGHPCPKCGGKDRFSLINPAEGATICRKCFSTKNGDGLAALQWLRGWSLPEACEAVAKHLGLSSNGNGHARQRRTILERVAAAKGCTVAGLRSFGADDTGRIPMYGWDNGQWRQCSTYKLDATGKGLNAKGKPAGVMLSGHANGSVEGPDIGQSWLLPEGVKDGAALVTLGYPRVAALPGARLKQEHAAGFRGVHVVLLPDADQAGRAGAAASAKRLASYAASVKIAHLPVEVVESGGQDVRDVLKDQGADAVRKCITDAAAPGDDGQPEPWPALEPLGETDRPLFPLDALPPVLRDWTHTMAESTQVPVDLPALLALATTASTIQGRISISPQEGWTEPTNLYVAVILEPANRKSAIFKAATAPLREVERQLTAEAAPRVARSRSERRQLESKLKRMEKIASEKGDEQAHDAALELAEQLAAFEDEPLPRLLVDDCTSEKLEMLLSEQDGKLYSASAEGNVFDLMAGKYTRTGSDFGLYLKAHSGDDIRVDRVGRPSIHIDHPTLTCAYTVQPDVLRNLARDPAFRGRGLLARFAYAAPVSNIGRRLVAVPPPDPKAVQRYDGLITALARSQIETTLTLSGPAARVFHDWQHEVEIMLAERTSVISVIENGHIENSNGILANVQDWGGKLCGLTARLAAILHVVEGGWLEVGPATVEKAIAIARYLIRHAKYVLGELNEAGSLLDDCRYLVRWIKAEGLEAFSQRDAHRHGNARWATVAELDAPLAELCELCHLRRMTRARVGKGRPPSIQFEVNPNLHSHTP